MGDFGVLLPKIDVIRAIWGALNFCLSLHNVLMKVAHIPRKALCKSTQRADVSLPFTSKQSIFVVLIPLPKHFERLSSHGLHSEVETNQTGK